MPPPLDPEINHGPPAAPGKAVPVAVLILDPKAPVVVVVVEQTQDEGPLAFGVSSTC